jgi:hypothetical protein
MTSHGVIFMASLIWLVVLVCVVYSLSQAPEAPFRAVARQSLRRMGKLGGVLTVLAVTVLFLSR